LFALMLATAVLLTACHRREAAAGKGKRQSGVVPVLVGKSQQDVRCKCARLAM
jgi:hypothetical protein